MSQSVPGDDALILAMQKGDQAAPGQLIERCTAYVTAIMLIGWRKAKKLFTAPLCGAAKQPCCFALYSLQ